MGKSKPGRPDETFTSGPLRVSRFGRVTVVESRWTREGFLHFQGEKPRLRSEAESALQQHIREVVDLIRQDDPLELNLFLENGVVDPTTYTESSSEAREYRAEYVFSVLAALEPHELPPAAPEKEPPPSLKSTLDALYSAARDVLLLEPHNPANRGLEEFRVQMFLRHLAIRGDS